MIAFGSFNASKSTVINFSLKVRGVLLVTHHHPVAYGSSVAACSFPRGFGVGHTLMSFLRYHHLLPYDRPQIRFVAYFNPSIDGFVSARYFEFRRSNGCSEGSSQSEDVDASRLYRKLTRCLALFGKLHLGRGHGVATHLDHQRRRPNQRRRRRPSLLGATTVMPADWKSLTHDILRQIYTFCGDGDLSRCARTCKNWTDPALDLLWFELQARDFVHLFSILAPLQPAQSQPSDTMTRLVR